MNIADILLRRLSLIFSVILVIALGVIATISVLGNDTADGEDVAVGKQEQTSAAAEPAGPESGEKIEIDDQQSSLSMACIASPANDGSFVVQITNQGEENGDFVIAVELQDSFGAATEHIVEATELRPGEARNLPVEADADSPDTEACFITALERDRQVILTGR